MASYRLAIKQGADFVAVVEERTPLRKAGGRLTGRCPFHEERTPSFSVNPVDKLYYCFGCGKGGDMIAFVRETQVEVDWDTVFGQLWSPIASVLAGKKLAAIWPVSTCLAKSSGSTTCSNFLAQTRCGGTWERHPF